MPQYDVAHICEQGQDIIFIPLSSSYQYKANSEQNAMRDDLQACARAAGLAGTVVTVWDAGGGRMGFLATGPWRPFFSSITLADVASNINTTLTCG
jgi:hypothetical protein